MLGCKIAVALTIQAVALACGFGYIAEGVQPASLVQNGRGNAVAAPLFAVRAAAQGDVILRGSGELKCRVTKGRTVHRQAARNRHTVNANLYRSRHSIVHHTVQNPTHQVNALALAIMATVEPSCADLYSEKERAARSGRHSPPNL